MDELLECESTSLDKARGKCVQDESKTMQEVTQTSEDAELRREVAELHRLPYTIKLPYPREVLEARSGAANTAEGRVRRDLVGARLGERADDGERGELGAGREGGGEGGYCSFMGGAGNAF